MIDEDQLAVSSITSVLLLALCLAWVAFSGGLTFLGIHEWVQFETDPAYRQELLKIEGYWNYESESLYAASLLNLILAGTIFFSLGILTIWKRGKSLIVSNTAFAALLLATKFTSIDEVVGRYLAGWL
ncbi:MAG: hypothetical protein ABF335_04135 [Alphaproteobacteria bacterium]